ncbi:MAG: HAD family hydrolase [Microthrixaceae bacterium]
MIPPTSAMSPDMARPLVLFDIDGTLLVAGDPDHIPCLTDALSEVFGRPVTLDGVPLGGNQELAIAREAARRAGVDDAEIDARLDDVMAGLGRRFLARVGDRRHRLLPGAPAAVAALAAAGWDLGLLSGGARAVSLAKVRAAGLADHFPFGAFGDDHEDRAELVPIALSAGAAHHGGHHRAGATVLVGDTPRDIDAARRAGCGVVAVATGRFGIDELAAHRPDAVLDDLSDPSEVVAACRRAVPDSAPGRAQG